MSLTNHDMNRTRAARNTGRTLADKVTLMQKTQGIAMRMKQARDAAAITPPKSTKTLDTSK